jgi:hypothetical protein
MKMPKMGTVSSPFNVKKAKLPKKMKDNKTGFIRITNPLKIKR